MILLIPLLVNLKKYIKDKKHIMCISIFTSIIIFILAMSIYMLLSNVDINFNTLEMPVVYVINRFFLQFKTVYGIVILLSIFTTAISEGITFLENVCKTKKYYIQIAGLMCISSILISKLGFSNLVNFLYPTLGYLGLLQIIKIIIEF